jgi:hypothetical protein
MLLQLRYARQMEKAGKVKVASSISMQKNVDARY